MCPLLDFNLRYPTGVIIQPQLTVAQSNKLAWKIARASCAVFVILNALAGACEAIIPCTWNSANLYLSSFV